MQYNDGVDRTRVRSGFSVLLVTAVVAAQSSGFVGAFQYDDLFAILINPHLEGWQTFVRHLGHMVRPVLHATLLFDRAIYGSDPSGYHVLNFALHCASAVLVYRLLSLAVSDREEAIPFWATLIFFVHPLTTETVTYISGRASGLMAFWYVFALFLYVKASTGHGHEPLRRLYLGGAVLAYVLSFGSKETAMTFPLVLLLWEVLIRRRDAATLRRTFFTMHIPFWIILASAAVWAWRHPRYAALAEFSLTLRPLPDNFLSELHAVAYAVVLFFCPWRQNFDHDLPEFHSPAQWPLPLDAVLLTALIAAAFVLSRRLPLFSFGIGWYFLLLLPTSVIPRADLLSERNLYPAFLGLALASTVLGLRSFRWLMARLRSPELVRVCAHGMAIGLVFLLSAFTYQRNLLYSDEVSLWSDTVLKSPAKARPHNNLGHAYAMHGEWDDAIEEFRIAAQLDPDYALARKNLHDAYLHVVGRE
ncbi:MAG TPA: tetratricopeptide repeat protein [Nitrospira sp.]|nr:tetratricopeptide repeat protein [Nitrospira sp.]HET8720856.1 tetratricopeptide repeat protein [Nitrospira sp.]